MALANHDPLAPGVYWIDLFNDARRDGGQVFNAWKRASDGVEVLRQDFSQGTLNDDTAALKKQVRIFTVFRVHPASVPPFAFPRELLGSPTIQKLESAPGGVTAADTNISSDSTVQKPAPAGLTEALENAFSFDTLTWAIILGLYLYTQQGNRR